MFGWVVLKNCFQKRVSKNLFFEGEKKKKDVSCVFVSKQKVSETETIPSGPIGSD